MATLNRTVSGQELNIRQSGEKEEFTGPLLPRILKAVRARLNMDVAFISEFHNGRRYFRYVDSRNPGCPVKVNGFDPLEESYCQRVVDGRLPGLIHNAASIPAARELSATTNLPVGAHMSVPITLKDGNIYGTFCCFSYEPDESLRERDLDMMHVFADIAAEQIDRDLETVRAREHIENRINSVLTGNSLSLVYQPIYHVEDQKIVGIETLARFSSEPVRTPDIWFNEAASVGLGIHLELKAIRLALKELPRLPADIYLSLNVSPEVIIDGDLESIFDGFPVERLLLEVTEHSAISHYSDFADKIWPLRKQGLKIAVDDAGAGYASLRHILDLAPDVIKLDISITRNIDVDPSRYAMASALVGFAKATGSKIVAEGVETESELRVLQQLGFGYAQGFLLGKPAEIEDVIGRINRPG